MKILPDFKKFVIIFKKYIKMVTSNFPFALLTYRVELQTKWPAIVPFQKIKSVKKPFFPKCQNYKSKIGQQLSLCLFACLLAAELNCCCCCFFSFFI